MGALLDALKSLKMWQVMTLIAALTGAAGATYGVYGLVDDSSQAGLGKNQQLIPVTLDNLVSQVSTNGSIIFPNRETLTFDTQGTVGEVLVEEGQAVEAGQVLARLDSTTVASLEKTVSQARIDLKNAEDALAKAKDPHTPLDLAEAEANVANASLSLQSAQDVLDRLLTPSSGDIARAESALANARLSLQDAWDNLEILLTPTSGDIAQTESAVADARLSLQDARDDLDMLMEATAQDIARGEAAVVNATIAEAEAQEAVDVIKNWPSSGDLADAQAQVDSTEATVGTALLDLKLVQKDWDDRVQTANDMLDPAIEGYQNVFASWVGIALSEEELELDPETLLQSWNIDLATLFDPDSRYGVITEGFVAQGPPSDDPETPWHEFVVWAWMNATPERLLITCENIAVISGTRCIRGEMDGAWETLASATDNLDTVETQAAKALANTEAAVTRAEENHAAAEENLADLMAGPDLLDIESKEKEQALAQANLEKSEEDLADLLGEPNDLEVAAGRKRVALGRASLEEAEEDLAKLLSGPDSLDVEARRKQIAVAEADLDEAAEHLASLETEPDALDVSTKQQQVSLGRAYLDEADEDLAELRGSADPLDVALRETEVVSARLALDNAVQRLEGAILTAPISGTVSRVNVEADQVVNANTPAIEIVDPTVVEVDGIVDEIDVLFVREGARADVTMDALPDRVLAGTVSEIASAAQNQQGVVSYPIRIQVQMPEDVQLVEGLSATASIVLREDQGVLLVPLQAVYGAFDEPLVRVMSSGRIEERAVVLGNNDEFWVVVSEGLVEGDQVVVETTAVSTDPFAQIRQQFQAGGGRGGAGGGFPGGGGGRQIR